MAALLSVSHIERRFLCWSRTCLHLNFYFFLLFQLLERELCIRQLRYSGMMETIRIRRAGYPIRHTFSAFIDRYQYLIPQQISSFPDVKTASKHICKQILGEQSSYQIGLTKIFLKVHIHTQTHTDTHKHTDRQTDTHMLGIGKLCLTFDP